MSDGGRAAARASDSVANQWRRGVREVAHFDTIHADDIAVSPNRGLLAIRSHTRGYPEDSVEIVLVDIKTGRERRRFRQASGSNRGAFFFGHGGDFLFAGDAEHADDDWTHRLRAIAVDSPRIVGKWRIDMLGIGADRLIAGIVDRTNRIVIIDTATAKTVQEFDGGPKVEDSIDDVRISPNGRLIARRLDRSVKIFDAATAEIVAMHKITPKSGNFGSFGFSADSRRFFVSATSYDEIQSTWVWDARDRNAPWRRLIVCDNHLCEPEISVSGNILIRRAGTIRLVDGARVPEMVRNGGILPGSISPGDRLFAYAVLGDSDEMTLKVVSLADRREIFSQKFEHGLRSVLDEHFFRSRYARFTPDASGLIVSAKLGKGLLTELHLIDASTFETIQIIRFQKLNRIVPIDGYAGFAAIDNGAVRIFKAGAP